MELQHLPRQTAWDSISQNPISTLRHGVLIALYIIVISVYRLTFHPLAKYPGPWLSKVTDAPGAYHVGQGRLHIETEKAHRQLGTIRPLRNLIVTFSLTF
ncbi:hypothetical protein MMC22_001010 [Lobaria immixta]|nr:hypothetical protein [Lobaria immixta]